MAHRGPWFLPSHPANRPVVMIMREWYVWDENKDGFLRLRKPNGIKEIRRRGFPELGIKALRPVKQRIEKDETNA